MIGVLCGLEREAAIARASLVSVPHQIICSGAVANNAREGASRLVQSGATHLLSFGLAGALDDALRPGDLLLPARIIDAEDGTWPVDPVWRETVRKRAPEGRDAVLLGVDKAARTVAQKLFLRGIFDAVAVDMESHFLARAAAEAGLPFLAIRAIADDSRSSLPDAAMAAVGEDGKEQTLEVISVLARKPGDLGGLIRLGLASGRGFRTLRRVAGLGLGPGL